MDRPTSSTSQLIQRGIHLAWPVLVAQLAMMAVIDTAMAGRPSAIDLASVGIAASIMATVLMTLVSVLLALPPIIAHLYGAGRGADVGREIHQSVWVSLVLALVAILLLCFPEPSDCDLAYGSIHFPFVLSAARSAVYRRIERKTLTTNGLIQRFLWPFNRHRSPAPGDVVQPALAGDQDSAECSVHEKITWGRSPILFTKLFGLYANPFYSKVKF